MSAARIEAVLFDLDGTLLHTSPDLTVAANAALLECGLPGIAPERVQSFVGKGIDELVARCLRHHGQPDAGELFARLRDAYFRHYGRVNGDHASFYDGVREGLDAFAAAGLKLGVCTNKSARFARPLLERFGIASRFEVIVGGDTAARKKPHGDPLLWACEAWSLAPAAVLMIGDSINDALGARAAGCPVWLVPYGYNEGMPVQGIECDGIVATLLEAAELLRQRNFKPYPHPNPLP